MKASFKTLAALLAIAGFAATGAVAATPAKPLKLQGAELAAQAKVGLDTARATALAARPGAVTEQELEKEAGGSGLRYSFVITSKGRPYEVGVDAATGKVLENIPEGKNPD